MAVDSSKVSLPSNMLPENATAPMTVADAEEDGTEETTVAAEVVVDIGTIVFEMIAEDTEEVVVVDTEGGIGAVPLTIEVIVEAIVIIMIIGEEATDTTTIVDDETTFVVAIDRPTGEAGETTGVGVDPEADHHHGVESIAGTTEGASGVTPEALPEDATTIATGVATMNIEEVVAVTTTMCAVVRQKITVGTIVEEMIEGIVGRHSFVEYYLSGLREDDGVDAGNVSFSHWDELGLFVPAAFCCN